MAWGYWMGVWVGNAAIAIATVAYLAELVPWIKNTVGAPGHRFVRHRLAADLISTIAARDRWAACRSSPPC